MEAHALAERGWSISAIARHLRRDRKTARAYVRGERTAGGGLLLWGAAGVGKTALLAEAAEGATARGYLVLRASGAQFECDMPFVGLHQLLHPIVDRIDGLAELQRDALRTALGARD